MADTFQSRLKYCMEYRRINAAKLSSEAGISEAALSRYLRGLRSPNVQTIISLADALNLSTDFLMGHSDLPEDIVLTRAFSSATKDDQHAIWTILEKYGADYASLTNWE